MTERFVDFYDLLGISPQSDAETIRNAIKEKRRVWNAKQNHPNPTTRSHAEQTMRDLNEAERTLLNPSLRASYDRERPERLAAAAASIPTQVSADDWEERVQFFIDNDNLVAAHRTAVEAVTHAPGSAKAWTLRGQASALLERYTDAEYELAEALRLDQNDYYPVYLLGETYRMQDKWQPAMAKFDQALRLSPDNPMVITSKAAVYIAIDQASQAVRLMEPVVRQHPNDEIYKFHLALAYHDEALSRLPKVPGTDSHIWTDAEHIRILRQAVSKIRSLNSPDPAVREAVQRLQAFADEGEQVKWDLTKPVFQQVAALLVFLPVCAGITSNGSIVAGLIVGLLLGGGVFYGLLYAFRRKPAWKLAKEAMSGGNLGEKMTRTTARAMAWYYDNR